VNADIDAQFQMPLAALRNLAGTTDLRLTLPDPVKLDVAGVQRTFKDGAVVSAAEIPALFAASGPSGYDAARMQEALWKAILDAAALRPGDARAKAVSAASGQASGGADPWYLGDALKGLTGGDAMVAVIPSDSRVAEGQFAFLPRGDEIMAAITRKAPGYRSRYTRCAMAAGVWASARTSPANWPSST
jgi:hypothetical protein